MYTLSTPFFFIAKLVALEGALVLPHDVFVIFGFVDKPSLPKDLSCSMNALDSPASSNCMLPPCVSSSGVVFSSLFLLLLLRQKKNAKHKRSAPNPMPSPIARFV